MSQRVRILIYVLLALSFSLAALFREFPFLPFTPFALAAFWGGAGLLFDFAWRIRKSPLALIPILLAFEILGEMFHSGNLSTLSKICFYPGAALFSVTGILFIWRGFQELRKDQWASASFLVFGFLTLSLNLWKYVTYHPEKYNRHAFQFRILFLAVMLWLLIVDVIRPTLKDRGYKTEGQIFQTGLFVAAIMFFVYFIFK